MLITVILLFLIPIGINSLFDNTLDKSIVLNANGTLDNKSNQAAINTPENAPERDEKKLAIITFDDGKKGQITNAKPILDGYNYTATFAIICNNVSKSDELNWNDIVQLEKEGYDIGSHSMNHIKLEDVPNNVSEYEISESKECLLDNGVKEVRVFTYPKNGGSDDPFILKEVSKHYDLARTGNDPLEFLQCQIGSSYTMMNKISCSSLGNDINKDGRYSIIGWSHDADREAKGYDDSQMLQKFIQVVESQNKYNKGNEIRSIPVLIYHDIDKESGFYTTSIELFKAEMKYLHDNDFIVIRLLDLI
ncbi:Polysaccharide deacetylase [Candidatus Nitrosocosmicus oleophilus]|jgi:peptidoglycan/xylan/chitin deacetylase (PgdA/CDA1 family)|uniref:Polysaccharide deacetylase n=1 Tax=Candidatus Nitrosocosmicus oleophilus TaxID=1353260 RepID=A0A654M006_9ARCH|nr:Polysaccharide deacetylase [Candidatus Nitrosocosmicus oleophilus]